MMQWDDPIDCRAEPTNDMHLYVGIIQRKNLFKSVWLFAFHGKCCRENIS